MAVTSDTRVRYCSSDPTARDFLDGLVGFSLVEDAPDVVVTDADESASTDIPTVTGPTVADGDDAPARLAVELREVAGHTPFTYPVPRDEAERLDAVHRYDTSDQTLNAHLNALSVAIAASLDATAGFIGLVDDDVETVLAADGFDVDEIPRSVAACTYGILRDDPLVIEDVATDSRVDTTDIGLPFTAKSYAGAPIRTEDGHAIGMVCVLDDEHRSYDESETDALTWFSGEVGRHLEDYGRQ